jgi:hypothetical protein
MSATETAVTADRRNFSFSATRAAVAVGYAGAVALYFAIFAIALVTLGLVLIRQANMVNFNDLIATLEQRDRIRTGLPEVLQRIREQHEAYDQALARSADCFEAAAFTPAEALGQDPAMPVEPVADRTASSPPKDCGALRNMKGTHANDLRLTEDRVMFKLANIEAYYMDYIDGITRKMPQVIPALRFLDSGNAWVDTWARSSFELMEMFLLVSMGMLGGIINVTRWLVEEPKAGKEESTGSHRPSLFAYFYKPAVGAAIALGAFIVFKASQLILVGHAEDGATGVAASIFLLAALGLVSGFCADKALRQIEKAADRLLRSDTPPEPTRSMARETPQPGVHLQVVGSASTGIVVPSPRAGRSQLRAIARAKAPELNDAILNEPSTGSESLPGRA